jgi:myo-inositol-1-phosphate synthase
LTIKLGVVGVGYLSSCLLNGLSLSKSGKDVWTCLSNPVRDEIPIPLSDIELKLAFEVDRKKIGRSVGDVVRSYYPSASKDEYNDIEIQRGVCTESDHVVKDVSSIWDDMERGETEEYLRARMKDIDVLLVASTTEPQDALTSSKVYSLYALQEGVSVINGIPTRIAGDEEYDYLAKKNGAVLFGNDFASGATPLTHDILAHLSQHARIPINIAQWQYASNMDFKSLSESQPRGIAKKESKSRIIEASFPGVEIPSYIGIQYIPPEMPDRSVPSFLTDPDTKHMYLNILYRTFAGTTNFITITAEISDSPSASVLAADLIRLVPLAKEKEDYVPVEPNAFYFKSPPKIFPSRIEAFDNLVKWLRS